MISKVQALLIAESLKSHEVKALNRLASVGNSYTRPKAIIGISVEMIERLMADGLAEQGIENVFLSRIGYRLSEKGSAVHAALNSRSSKTKARLHIVPPRLKTPPPRF